MASRPEWKIFPMHLLIRYGNARAVQVGPEWAEWLLNRAYHDRQQTMNDVYFSRYRAQGPPRPEFSVRLDVLYSAGVLGHLFGFDFDEEHEVHTQPTNL